MLSLFPAIAACVVVYGLFMDISTLQQHLTVVQPFVPIDTYALLESRLEALVKTSDTRLGLGLLLSLAVGLWSGSRGTSALISLIGSTYKEKDKRGFVESTAISVGITIAAMIFVIATLAAVAAVPLILELVPLASTFVVLVELIRWPLVALFAFVAIACLYKYAPDRRPATWRWIVPGALAAAILWLAASALFSIYVEKFGNYSTTFGPLATAVVLLLWFHYSVMIVALGAELNAQLELQTRRDSTIGPNRPMSQRNAYVADHTKS